MPTDPVALAHTLADVSRGADHDEDAVLDVARRLSAAIDDADEGVRGKALAVLLERLRTSSVDDADGVAHVALAAGALVETGLPADELAAILLDKVPAVLVAARRYADRCLAHPDMPKQEDEEEDEDNDDEEEDDDTLLQVDERDVPIGVFAAGLDDDRAGAAALYALHEWTLPTVSSWSRSRGTLKKAVANEALQQAAAAMSQSSAFWIDKLLSVQLEATWLIVSPLEQRAFRVVVDEVVSNFDLHALLAAALLPLGLAGTGNDKAVTDFISGAVNSPDDDVDTDHVVGTWNLYTWHAAPLLATGLEVPSMLWVWGEGEPLDVPSFNGERVVVVGPPAYERGWGLGRVFSGLHPRITVQRELAKDEVDAWMQAAAAGTPTTD